MENINNNKINYVVDIEHEKANIYFNDKLIYSGKSGKYGMNKLCKYGNYYITSEMIEFYGMITIIKDGKILLRYHAYNAANLDGGDSSVMVVNDKIINHPFNWSNREETRPIASGFVVTE